MKIKPVPDEAALLLGKSLVVADLHIGIEEEFRQKGYNIPSLTHHMEKRLIMLIEGHKVDKLIVLGDLKHRIIGFKQDYREVKRFLERILEYVDVELAKGNHDGGLQYMIRSLENVTLHTPKGFKMKNFGLFHGHAHPSEDLWKSQILIMGHEHPVVRFVDRLGIPLYMKAWLRIGFRDSKVKPEELVVVPAFNDYLGGTAVNAPDVKFLGPIMKKKYLDLKGARLYLLDGTFLGKRKDLIYE